MSAFVYILRCSDNSLYTGWTTEPANRLVAHNTAKGAKYTKSRLPVIMVYCEQVADKSQALKREIEIKKLKKLKKELLIAKSPYSAEIEDFLLVK